MAKIVKKRRKQSGKKTRNKMQQQQQQLPKLKGYGLTKSANVKIKRKKEKKAERKEKIHVDSRQLAGLAPMNTLELYKSQLASGIST